MSATQNKGSVGSNVVRSGYLKKIKTSRRKWFVLRRETPDCSAKLEYYDSEKKYQSGVAPKRSIPLKTCFNINRTSDPKNKHGIALYTKDDCFSVAFDTEEDMDAWFKELLSLQHGEDIPEGETPRPTFEHVWQVKVLQKGLGATLLGHYRLCLTDKTLTLVKKDNDAKTIECNLSTIRSCGYLKNYVYLEFGRKCSLGSGELWMETEDHNIAANVDSTIQHAMFTSAKKDDLGPKSRTRSSSATESSKPTYIRKFHHTTISKPHIFPPSGVTSAAASTRERCDSLPSRARTSSEGNHVLITAHRHLAPSYRHVSVHIGHSPPHGSPVSPPSVTTSTDSAGSSYSLADEQDEMDNTTLGRYIHSPDEAIEEEECDSPYVPCGNSPCTANYCLRGTYMQKTPPQSSDDGYVEMQPKGSNQHITPAHSLSSVTSGTNSTDLRFPEYQLDKVHTYFAPSDDESRPARAYSVGSRPECAKQRSKHGLELMYGTQDNPRCRAFSVGAKTKKGPSRVLPPHGHSCANVKSSSAPLLSSNRVLGSYNSIGGMDDLMEMDFSRSSNTSSNHSNSGYIDMTPGIPKTPQNLTTTSNTTGYVEMKPINTQQTSPYVLMTAGTSPARQTTIPETTAIGNGYMDMNPAHTSKARISCSPAAVEFTDISNQMRRSPGRGVMQNGGHSPSFDYLDMTCNNRVVCENAQTPEGYVEMSVGRGHQRQSSLDGAQLSRGPHQEEYTIMAAYSTLTKKPSNPNLNNVYKSKDKTRSLPITIQSPFSSSTSQYTSSKIPTSGASVTTGFSPKMMQLPLNNANTSPYSSLRRSRKNSRRDSRDSSSSSVTTTPSSGSTIFPFSLNSPSSPIKPDGGTTKHNSILSSIYKAGSRLTNRNSVSCDDYTVMDFEKDSNRRKDTSEYVNYSPAVQRAAPTQPPTSVSTDDGDYAIMKPGHLDVASRVSGSGTASPLVSHLSHMGLNEHCFRPISDNLSERISPKPGDVAPTKPESDSPYETLSISRNSECVSPVAKISRPNSVNSDNIKNRPGSVMSLSSTSDLSGSTSTLVNSRPDSMAATPENVQLHYASLDLQMIDDDVGTSPRGSKAEGSSAPSEPTFTYAEIDFVKSDTMKQSKVKN